MIEYKGYNYEKQGQTYTVYDKQGKAWIVGFKTEEEAREQIDDLVLQETVQEAVGSVSLEDRVSALEDMINMSLGF